eukprot:CAMPEP_0118683798 /NCGR_PEP_ID=MMETSP0800-20121206/6258_1 /TAXON_ID=210618 ORGANISM="Striatella unipunctata, Strain CCMP2910" /NCGR_SAMPLE_ID=MMETSP0800 /ASSEMBLY_ACC=CAM_ASM_000638 /LENGTH=92 /DNA_ID=CAMNT_0006580373 /DNA_START=99 /DNA_END=377 /DNA_ORIENTATION=+
MNILEPQQQQTVSTPRMLQVSNTARDIGLVLLLVVFAFYSMGAKLGVFPWFWGPNRFPCLRNEQEETENDDMQKQHSHENTNKPNAADECAA